MTVAPLDRPAPIEAATRRQVLTGAGARLALGDRAWPALATSDSVITGGFPVTIDHKYGSAEVTAEPSRVVTVGVTEQDPVLALG
ncbi:MAG: hypothetical protein ACRD0K_19125 [Egibacteraceae bacterium]